MVTLDDERGTAVQQRTTRLRPPGFWRAWLIGRPLRTADAPHQTIGKAIGLAVFASDALSSTAYATQEILFILAAAGMVAFGYAFPIAIAIAGLLVNPRHNFRYIYGSLSRPFPRATNMATTDSVG
jgi:hypothetical protein